MARFTFQIDLSGDAFSDERGNVDCFTAGPEVARMLRKYADKIDQGYGITTGKQLDINGNYAGIVDVRFP